VSKRNVIVVTQAVQMLQALVLGVLILTGTVRFWHVAVLATVLGTAQAFDIPARQAFIFEMVEGTDILNAVGLNSTIVNVAVLLGSESIFVMNFTILATVFAKDVLRMQAAQFGLLMSAQGAGALVGAITVASLSHLGPRPGFLFGGALVLTLANIALGAIHQFHAAAVVLGIAGPSMVAFTATVNTT